MNTKEVHSIVPVLLSGGSGTRLWPLSRSQFPKQFLPLAGERTMLQETMERVAGVAGISAPIPVCNEAHRFLVADQLREMGWGDNPILLEPEGKNTAPAIALAALEAERLDSSILLLVLPADHVVDEPEFLQEAITVGREPAEQGSLVTFGIVPNAPETGFGYIRTQESPEGQLEPLAVAEFVEKPDRGRAETFVESGDYFWNSGMFLFRADTYLSELGRHAPEILGACRQAFESAERDMDFVRVNAEAFAKSPEDSIDYAVMEKTETAYMVPIQSGWSDVGSWSALFEVTPKDENGNVVRGDVISRGDSNCYLRAESRLLVTSGLEDHVVVETADSVLVAHKNQAQGIKGLVNQLKSEGRDEHQVHRRVYRPWGAYEQIALSKRSQVKRLFIKPGACLSLQMHHHRAEHWVVVQGTAQVTRDGEIFLLTEDQSTYLPVGCYHRIENPGVIPLELIEVQTGGYLGEDDIVRFEDSYGRG
ncbi:mannose-1-phosphate guanylyltransferase/mannose-6-phosphate isomerase [Thiohalorhabdus methylotrophus]|uniref:mannose-1-phosphate guanylyltransferase n=1 Tax=Thiohalorhabdus methylotrophus TaxID=3242694 RepID=A0ABV4U2C3_9GAMM